MRVLGLGVAHDSSAVIINTGEIDSYIKIPIVGNKFQSRKPNKHDVNILLIGC